jgi:hypothetical protein
VPVYSVKIKGQETVRVVKAMTIAGARNHVLKDMAEAKMLDAETAFELFGKGIKMENATAEAADEQPEQPEQTSVDDPGPQTTTEAMAATKPKGGKAK